MRAKSVGPASTEPKSTWASSNSQKRAAGMPRKLTGAGMTSRVISVGALSVEAPRVTSGLASNAYQSRWPSKYSCAVSTHSPSPSRVATENAYSMRSGNHDGLTASGSLKSVSYHCNQSRAAFSTSAKSAGVICRAGAMAIAPAPAERKAA